MLHIVLADEITRPEDNDRPTGAFDRLRRRQQVPTVERQEELCLPLSGCRQDMDILGSYVSLILVHDVLGRYGKKLPIDLCQQLIKATEAFWREAFKGTESFQKDYEGGLSLEPTNPTGIEEKCGAAIRRTCAGHQH